MALCLVLQHQVSSYIIARPDSQFLRRHVYILSFSVASTLGSVTLWWQSYACNCSMFCTCIQSGPPHNVVHVDGHVVACTKSIHVQ